MVGKLDTTYGFNATCVSFAALGVVCALVYLLFLRSPDQLAQKPLGWEKAEALAAEEGKGKSTEFGVEYKDALKSPALYMILFSCLLWALSMVLAPYLATIMMSNGVDEMAAANYSSIKNLSMAIMAIVVGMLTSKLGSKAYIVTAFGAGIAGLATVYLWVQVSRADDILLIAAILMGCGYIVGTTYGPMITTKVFGNKAYDNIIPQGC